MKFTKFTYENVVNMKLTKTTSVHILLRTVTYVPASMQYTSFIIQAMDRCSWHLYSFTQSVAEPSSKS